MWNPPGSNPSLQQQQHQPRGAALHNQPSYFTPSSPQPPSPSSYTSGRRGVVGGAGSDVSRTPPSSTTSTTTAATTSPQWRASATDRSPHISSPTGNLPSGTGFTGNVHTDPVQPIPSAGSPRSTSPQDGGGDGGDTRSSTSRSRGFNRLFSALDDAAQSIPRGSPVAAMTSSSSSSSDDDDSDSSSSSSRSLSGGSMPHAPDDIMSSHASQRGGGSIQNESIFSGGSMPTSGGATMPAIKEPTDLLSKFASRMVSNQWRAQTASTLGAGVVVGGGSGGGVTKTSSMTSPGETNTPATEAAQSKVATSPGVSGRGAIVFTDSPHPHSNTTSYAHKVGDYNLNDSGGPAAATTSSSGRREYGFGMDGFGDGGSGRGGVLGSVGDLGCSSRSDHDDNASVQHSTFTLNSQLTGGGPSLMHSAMGSVHTVSTSAGGLNSMHSNASKGSRPWTMMIHNGADDIMTNAFGAKMQRNALLYAIVDENVRTQSRSDPLNTGSMTPGRAGGSGLGSSAEHHNSNHWSPPASMSFGSPPASPADVLQHHSNQQLHPTNTNNLSTTASPDAKLARPVPTKGVQFQSYTEPTTTDANSNNTNQQQNGYSMASLSHTAPLPAKKDRSPDGIMNEGNGGLHPHSGGGLDNSVMTSFVSGEAAPIESPPALVPTPPRGPNHSRSLSASRDSDDVERCEVTGERRADLPPAPPQGARKGFPPGRPEPLQHPVNTVIPHAPRMIKVPNEDGRNKRKLLRYRPAPRSGPASLAKFIDSDTVSDETAKAQSEFQEAIGAHQCWPGSGHQDAPQQGLKFGSSNDTTQLDHTFTTFNTQGGGGTTTRNGPTSCETTFVSFGTGLLSRSPQSGSGRPAVSLLGGGSSGSGRNRLGFDLEDSNMGGTMTTFGTTALPAPRAQIQHHHNHTMGGGGLHHHHHHHHQDDHGIGNSLSNGDLSSMGVGGEEDGSEEGVMGGWGDEGGALPIPSSRNPMVMHHHNGAPLSPSSNATNATTFGTDPNNTKSDPTRSGGGATGSDDLIRGGGATGVNNVPGVVSLPQAATKNSSSKRRTHSSLSDEDLEMNSESGGVGVLGDFASLPVPVKGIDSPTENFPLETVPAPAPRRLNAPWTKVNVEGRTSASTKATPPPPPTATTTAQPSYRVGGML